MGEVRARLLIAFLFAFCMRVPYRFCISMQSVRR